MPDTTQLRASVRTREASQRTQDYDNDDKKMKSNKVRSRPLIVVALLLGSALLSLVLVVALSSKSTQTDTNWNALPGNALSVSKLQRHTAPQKSHLLSLDPLEHSLHPHWKLWSEMSPAEQDKALDAVGVYLKKYGELIMPVPEKQQKIKHGQCDLIEFTNGHSLCGPPPDDTCTFFSFGINDDPSFDKTLAEKWNCRGFAGDPTVDHPSRLHPKVTFHNVGASMLVDNEERLVNKGGEEDWWVTSMPKLRYWLGVKHVNVLKLDCEGCEFAFARDILREDPDFLKHVDQMSIETHVSKAWMTTREHLYYFGLHFALLEEAGFKLEWSDVFGCSKRHEVPGCLDEMYGFPCGYKDWPGHPNVVRGWSCQDFLWKRY